MNAISRALTELPRRRSTGVVDIGISPSGSERGKPKFLNSPAEQWIDSRIQSARNGFLGESLVDDDL